MQIRKAKDAKGDQKIKALIYAQSGGGKTTFCARCPKPLILLTELQGVPSILAANPEAEYVIVKTADDMRNALKEIRELHAQGKAPWETICLDGITESQIILKDELMARSMGKEKLTLEDWGILIDKTISICRSYRDLPFHVVVTALATEEVTKEEGRIVRPSVYGKRLPNEIAGFFNVVSCLFKKTDDDGFVVHKALISGVDRFLTKGHPGLDGIEVPELDVWIEKMSRPVPTDYFDNKQPKLPDSKPKINGGGKK